jgi:hypothetical protein
MSITELYNIIRPHYYNAYSSLNNHAPAFHLKAFDKCYARSRLGAPTPIEEIPLLTKFEVWRRGRSVSSTDANTSSSKCGFEVFFLLIFGVICGVQPMHSWEELL